MHTHLQGRLETGGSKSTSGPKGFGWREHTYDLGLWLQERNHYCTPTPIQGPCRIYSISHQPRRPPRPRPVPSYQLPNLNSEHGNKNIKGESGRLGRRLS